MQLRKEYEEKLREEARRAALKEMEKKRLAALEAEKGEKEKGESKGGEGEKPKETKVKDFFTRSKQKGSRIRAGGGPKGYDTLKSEEKAKKHEPYAIELSDSENEVGRGGGGGGVVGDAHGDQGAGVRVGHSRLLRRRECVAHEMGEL